MAGQKLKAEISEQIQLQKSEWHTLWLEILWWGIHFGRLAVLRAIRQYCIRQLHNVMSSLLHNHSFHLYNRPAARRASLIVGMESTSDSCIQGHHVSIEFWTTEVGEDLTCQHEEGNLNNVYAVAVKTDTGIVSRGRTR